MAAPRDGFFFQLHVSKPPTEGRSLYMCFRELRRDKSVALMIQAISLTDLLNRDGEVKFPSPVAHRILTKDECGDELGCGVCCSQIFFAGGKGSNKMFTFDPLRPNPNLVMIPDGPRSPKVEPYVVGMNDNRLYVLSRVPKSSSDFEAVDFSSMNWNNLPEPPYTDVGPYFCPATDGNNIFLLGLKAEPYMCWFSHLKNTWEQFNNDRPLPFTVGPPALVIKDLSYNYNILFTYECNARAGPNTSFFLGAFLILEDADDTRGPVLDMLTSLEFQHGVPPEFSGSHCQLVHGGGRHIFLTLYSYSPQISDHQRSHQFTGRMKVCVIHFKYDFEGDLAQPHFLLYRQGAPYIMDYQYDHNLPNNHVAMIGAFVLPSISGNT